MKKIPPRDTSVSGAMTAPDEIAEIRRLKVSTIFTHLEKLLDEENYQPRPLQAWGLRAVEKYPRCLLWMSAPSSSRLSVSISSKPMKMSIHLMSFCIARLFLSEEDKMAIEDSNRNTIRSYLVYDRTLLFVFFCIVFIMRSLFFRVFFAMNRVHLYIQDDKVHFLVEFSLYLSDFKSFLIFPFVSWVVVLNRRRYLWRVNQ